MARQGKAVSGCTAAWSVDASQQRTRDGYAGVSGSPSRTARTPPVKQPTRAACSPPMLACVRRAVCSDEINGAKKASTESRCQIVIALTLPLPTRDVQKGRTAPGPEAAAAAPNR